MRDVSITEFLAVKGRLEPLTRQRARHVITENVRTLNAAKAMQNADATLLGQLMNESHVSLRDDFEVSNDALNTMVTIAQQQPGCFGARMTGAGFGGCAVALVEAAQAPTFAQTVTAEYVKTTGCQPQIYITIAADGAEVVAQP